MAWTNFFLVLFVNIMNLWIYMHFLLKLIPFVLTNSLLKLLDDYDTIKNILKNICMYKKKILNYIILYKIFQ